MSLNLLLPMALASIRQPREAFGRLLRLDLPAGVLWQALLLVVVISVLMAEATALLVRPDPAPDNAIVVPVPFVFGAIQFAVLALTVLAIDRIGRAMGGSGTLPGALLAVVWLQFVMICLQVVQSLVIILIPPLGGLIVMGGLVLFLYLLTNFIAELHGFTSRGRVFGMIVFVLIGVALALSFLLTLLGVTVSR